MEDRNNSSALRLLSLLLLLLLLTHSLPSISAAENSLRKTYIIRVEKISSLLINLKQWYHSFLPPTTETSNIKRMIYTYENTITGFAARLTEKEVDLISAMPGFISAHADRIFSIQTTHTPSFLGLVQDAPGNGNWKGLGGGEGIVIGVLDSGIFPDHPSFSGEGMPPPPAKWKGRCDFNASQCNNKLIGARAFLSGSASSKGMLEESEALVPPYDNMGHGTHTASTAAGAIVEDAQVLGIAKGVAIGMAPRAHLAIYKVCTEGCHASDILAGMESAVEDGVDVLSISLCSSSVLFFEDELAIASYRAVEKGIFVSCAGGNSGPDHRTLFNEAPWILTVAASSTDRTISATVKIGNGLTFSGKSLYQPNNFTSTQLALVYAGQAENPAARFCGNGSLDGLDVRGKVVLCDKGGHIGSSAKGKSVKAAGGAAIIISNREQEGYSIKANLHVLPASEVSFYAGSKIKSYISDSQIPTASIIFEGTIIGISPAPAMAFFSSRGPSVPSPGILKPDITGPGVDILAAWPFPIGPPTPKPFNIISGTSMSAPHLAGIAALIKSNHPNWSAAAIKSAIMTTADIFDQNKRPIVDERGVPADHFTLGAGHVNPMKAMNPGLVYDTEVENYTPYLCGLNYTSREVNIVTGKKIDCSKIKSISEADLNYPSVLVSLGEAEENVTVWRTVKNVGEAMVDYMVKVDEPKGVVVAVEPNSLRFEKTGEEKRFALTFTGSGKKGEVAEGRIKWVSSKYDVSSPITVMFTA
ncbi:subtilisin-like protease SBT1.7 [Phalaenopsis equestris]|uniref:subtilisin-like protease SBT1.7 n=1 Tax=Phalaenopsis equestris TaxID=78828 RepID=UPI0009E2A92D|nr:subtilisin-like protease SBT1.7 [Phalaenopsis equestris]